MRRRCWVSPLAVAAPFRPARRGIRDAVDLRFYRAKYDDVAASLERLTARLRAEVELETLAADLRSVVGETVQPALFSLWLREPGVRA